MNKVYRGTAEYARANNELEQYRESYRLNKECKRFMEQEISKAFDGFRLANGPEEAALEKYGADRVTYVLANTLRELNYDGRFSRANKEWAAGISVVPSENNVYLILTTHPAILDGFVNKIRKLTGMREENES